MVSEWPATPRTANYMVSESDGWHLERPCRAWADFPTLQWPEWPARPRTAIIWFPKATDGTSPLKGLADFPTNGHSGQPSPGQQLYMISESDGWHLALEKPRRAWADFPTNGHSGQPGPGQQLYGFRKRRTAPLKGLAAPEPTFPPMATVASQAQDSNYMVSESDGWHLALERPRRACADFFTNGHRGQPCPGQQLYGFRKRRKASPRLRRLSHQWPQWPARPSTAIIWFPNGQPGPGQPIIWFPKATDGTLKGLAAPEPIFPPMATVASQAQDSNYIWLAKPPQIAHRRTTMIPAEAERFREIFAVFFSYLTELTWEGGTKARLYLVCGCFSFHFKGPGGNRTRENRTLPSRNCPVVHDPLKIAKRTP